jgi:methionyl-tRNA formyltransferase
MKILFCVNRDIYANVALNHIFPALSPDDEAMVLFSEATAGTRATGPGLTFLRFYEQDLLNGYIFPQLEQHSLTGENGLKTFAQLEHFYGFPMQVVPHLKNPETLALIEQFEPDLLVSIRFGHIFKQQILQLPKLGVINLHSGLLPEYRGILATFWSLLHGKKEYGYTLHTIPDASIDTGAIIDRQSLPVNPKWSLFEHILSLYTPAANSILQALNHYRQGATPPVFEQNEADSGYFSLPKPEDLEQLIAQGFQIFDKDAYFQHLQRFNEQPLALPEAEFA